MRRDAGVGAAVVEAVAVGKVVGDGADRRAVLTSADLSVGAGELVAVVGASGSGKTTLLHLLAGIDCPTTGTIVVDGRSLASLDDAARTVWRRRRIGLVLQFFHLLPTLGIEENVALPLLLDGVAPTAARTRARAALAAVGLGAMHAPDVRRLSGGELQRVAVARALVAGPAVVLADEPTGSLDGASSGRLLDLLLGACRDRGVAAVLATHDPAVAARAHRTVVLHGGRLAPADMGAAHSCLTGRRAGEKVTDAA